MKISVKCKQNELHSRPSAGGDMEENGDGLPEVADVVLSLEPDGRSSGPMYNRAPPWILAFASHATGPLPNRCSVSATLSLCDLDRVRAETQGEVDSTPPPSSPSPSQAVGDTDIDSSRGRSSVVGLVPRAGMGATGDLLESFLAQKDRLLYQTRGVVLPSAQPQDLLPLLGRGLSVRGLSGGLSLDQQGLLKRIGSLVSQPHDSGPPLPSQPSQSDNKPIPSSQPGTHTSTHTPLGQRDEVTAIVMATMAADTPSPAVSGCMVNFSDPEGYIDSSDDPPLPDGTFLHCTYTITVYTGYGVELQVKSVNLSEGEQLSIRGVDEGGALLVLANHTLLVEGQVIRSPTNTISVYYRSLPEGGMGMFQLHYQIFRLSCALPRRPHFGEVSVLDLLPGGTARFHCHMGYHLQGAVALTCLNASLPVWSSKEPSCRALCGGSVKNATVGRVLSPSPRLGPDATQDRSCSWSMEAPTAQRLHLHLERLALGPTERMRKTTALKESPHHDKTKRQGNAQQSNKDSWSWEEILDGRGPWAQPGISPFPGRSWKQRRLRGAGMRGGSAARRGLGALRVLSPCGLFHLAATGRASHGHASRMPLNRDPTYLASSRTPSGRRTWTSLTGGVPVACHSPVRPIPTSAPTGRAYGDHSTLVGLGDARLLKSTCPPYQVRHDDRSVPMNHARSRPCRMTSQSRPCQVTARARPARKPARAVQPGPARAVHRAGQSRPSQRPARSRPARTCQPLQHRTCRAGPARTCQAVQARTAVGPQSSRSRPEQDLPEPSSQDLQSPSSPEPARVPQPDLPESLSQDLPESLSQDLPEVLKARTRLPDQRSSPSPGPARVLSQACQRYSARTCRVLAQDAAKSPSPGLPESLSRDLPEVPQPGPARVPHRDCQKSLSGLAEVSAGTAGVPQAGNCRSPRSGTAESLSRDLPESLSRAGSAESLTGTAAPLSPVLALFRCCPFVPVAELTLFSPVPLSLFSVYDRSLSLAEDEASGSEWKVTVRSGVVDCILKGPAPPTYWPRIWVVTSSPSRMVNMSLSLRFRLKGGRISYALSPFLSLTLPPFSLNLSDSDMLTILDGDEVTTHILGQYVGGAGPFKIQSTTPDLTVTFHSDPAGLVFGKGEGFIINYMEVSRNDSCPDLPEIQNGWKTTSHTALVRGARITYQCDPGYDLVGRETLTCQLDLTWSTHPPFCEKIMYCSDPGHVEHSTRSLSDPKLLVGTTIQYSCYPGFIMQGGATLTCYGREPGTPVWTSKLPHCVSEESVSCENPGIPDNGYQILSKRLYLPSESLTFICYQGFELIGEVAIKCILGNPSLWSGPLPLCRANHDCFGNHALEVVEAAAGSGLDGGNMALAIFILVLLLSVLLGGAYVYITRCRYHSNLRLPLIYPHPYSQITVESEFDNPLYETGGDNREYEVSI
ncbi:seizure 6-like protein [Salvelinus sp. IW2-2015]|uniref:seizure 6-like protein n=1 Tax=Salvelinus sp. IW2-2015 TaxID=2691554 RepID=UPI0038D4BE65